MKKFLVLTLILGVASWATAGLATPSADLSPGDSFTIVYTNDVLLNGVSIRVISDDASDNGSKGTVITAATLHADLTLGRKLLPAGVLDTDTSTTTVMDSGSGDGIGGAINLFAQDPPIAIGSEIFTITFQTASDAVAGTYTISFDTGSLKDNENNVIALGSFTYKIVPEPATMALLGLGALVLRRKK